MEKKTSFSKIATISEKRNCDCPKFLSKILSDELTSVVGYTARL